MTSTGDARARRSTMTAVIAVSLLATFGVDLARAASSSGSASHHAGAAAHHSSSGSDEGAYLTALRPIAVQMHDAVAPDARALNTLIQPKLGAAYAARDAVIHGESLDGVRSATASLQKLTAPTALAADQKELVKAATQMEKALKNVRRLSSASGAHLVLAMNNFSAGTFETGQASWQVALEDAYTKGRETTPPGVNGSHLTSPASQTWWIYSADRDCSASTYRLGDVAKLATEHSVGSAIAFDDRWKTTLTWLDSRLRTLPRPHGASALPTTLSERFKTLSYNAKVMHELAAALHGQSLSRFNKAYAQLRQVGPSLRALGTEFNRYGAKSCGEIVAEFGGKKPTVPGHASTVNT